MLNLILRTDARCRPAADLPQAFRDAVKRMCTLRVPAHGRQPERIVPMWAYDPANQELSFPLSYWPQFLQLAREHGIEVAVTDQRPAQPVVDLLVAVDRTDIPYGMQVLQERLARHAPAWPVIALRLTAYEYVPIAHAEPRDYTGEEWARFQAEPVRGTIAPLQPKQSTLF